MYSIQVVLRFFCFDIFYMTAKGALDLFWGYPAGGVLVFEFITTMAIIPFFILADYVIHLFEKRQRLIYLYDVLWMMICIPFIASLLRHNSDIQGWWNRAVYMMTHGGDAQILYFPLTAGGVLGYAAHGLVLKKWKKSFTGR
jgi:hypothetical protein